MSDLNIVHWKDTAANWTSSNTVLPAGVYGHESDTGKLKVGNGTTTWKKLKYTDPEGLPIDASIPLGMEQYQNAAGNVVLPAGAEIVADISEVVSANDGTITITPNHSTEITDFKVSDPLNATNLSGLLSAGNNFIAIDLNTITDTVVLTPDANILRKVTGEVDAGSARIKNLGSAMTNQYDAINLGNLTSQIDALNISQVVRNIGSEIDAGSARVKNMADGRLTNQYDAVNVNNLTSQIDALNIDEVLRNISSEIDASMARIKNLGDAMMTNQDDAINVKTLTDQLAPANMISTFKSSDNSVTITLDTITPAIDLTTAGGTPPPGPCIVLFPWFNPTQDAGTWNFAINPLCAYNAYYGNDATKALNDKISWRIPIIEGTYEIGVQYVKDSDKGVYGIQLDNVTKNAGTAYSDTLDSAHIDKFSNIVLGPTGVRVFSIKMIDKATASSAYGMQISCIRLTRTA